MYKVILDTNVVVSALRSNLGASFRLLNLLGDSRWRPCLTNSLLLEYEDVLKRDSSAFGLALPDVDDFLDYFASQSSLHMNFFHWRLLSVDVKDSFVLEAAVTGQAQHIITFNKRHFPMSASFGISCLSPREFLILMGESP